jgi:hypothetical protein
MELHQRSQAHERIACAIEPFIPFIGSRTNKNALAAIVVQAEQKAAKYGIVGEHGIAVFALLMAAVNGDFEAMPPVRAYLTMTGLDGDSKMNLLAEIMYRNLR